MSLPRQNDFHTKKQDCPIEEKSSFLQRLKIFRNAPLDIIKLYAYLANREEYLEHEPILLQGDSSSHLYMIMSGEVAICEEHYGKNYHLQVLSGENLDFFGELSLLTTFPSFYTAWAKTNVSLLSISREAFRKVMEKYPQAYPVTVEKITKLQIDQFIARTDQLILKTEQTIWSECVFPNRPSTTA